MVSVAIGFVAASFFQGTAAQPTPGHPVLLPTEWYENRFIVTPITSDGRKLRLFTDSAGALLLVTEVAQELKLPITDGKPQSAPWPTFKSSASIPSCSRDFWLWSRKQTDEEFAPEKGIDGMLGQQWFAGCVWTFDYPRRRLYWRAPGDLPKHSPEHEAKLGFRKDALGERENNFATIHVNVDGETLLFTLDTGATDVLGDDVLKQINDGRPADRATSFLGQSVYDRWHKEHPTWRVTAATTTGLAMIEAPKIIIGGYEVGPVWFSVQRDQAFSKYMAQWTDRVTDGSIGGSAFRYFRMTVDWPNATAVFER
jgi:hypothetical protein